MAYQRTGRQGPLQPADIPRPDLARDPGVTARPEAELLPQVVDTRGRAIEAGARTIGQSEDILAKSYRSFSADMLAIGKTFEELHKKRQDLEDRAFVDRFQLEFNKRATTIETEALNSPESAKPDFVQNLDGRLAEAQRETFDALTGNVDYVPSDRGRRGAENAAMGLRTTAARRAAVNAHNQRISLLVDETRNNVIEIAKTAAANGDYTSGLERATGAVDMLSGVLAPDKLRAMREAARDTVVNLSVAAMSPARQMQELRAAPTTREEILDRFGGAENATGDPAARAKTSSAMGNFQFIDETWLAAVGKYRPDLAAGRAEADVKALRKDPALSRELAGKLLDENEAALKSAGLKPTPGNLYLAHFLGAPAAIETLKADGGTPMADLVPDQVIDANRSVLLGKTAGTVIDWAARKMGGAPRGAGRLVDILPEGRRQELLTRANAETRRQEREQESADYLEQFNLKSKMESDLTSTIATGVGLTDLSADKVKAVFGSKVATEWQARREDARTTWQATHDLAGLSEGELTQRLDTLRPVAGEVDYARREIVYNTARQRVDDLRKQRNEDPAASVAADPEVRRTQAGVDFNKPETVAPFVTARLAAQERAGIPEENRSPISRNEALALTVPLRRMLPGEERQTLTELGNQFKALFGDQAEQAFSYALRANRVDKETSQIAARIARKLAVNEVPSVPEARVADQKAEIAAAQRAVFGTFPSETDFMVPPQNPTRVEPVPSPPPAAKGINIPAPAIQYLLTHPDTAAQFDKRYGKGQAKKILDKYPVRAP